MATDLLQQHPSGKPLRWKEHDMTLFKYRTARTILWILIVIGLIVTWPAPQKAQAANTYYVDATSGSDLDDGLSWYNAFASIQKALDTSIVGDQIWVATGTYYPSVENGGTGDRFKSFQMKDGVAIYGGFDPANSETSWAQRDWENNETIICG